MKPGGIVSNTKKTAQDVAKIIAKQVAQEPLEILKDAREQVTGEGETVDQPTTDEASHSPDTDSDTTSQKLQDKAFAERRMKALQNEVQDIRKQKVFKDLQQKITDGEEVPLENYPDLSLEQKQILKAQMEAVKKQKENAAKSAGVQEIPTVSSKPSRRWGAGQKQEAEKQQTRVEKPVPPSG